MLPGTMGWEEHVISVVFLPKTYNPNLKKEKIPENPNERECTKQVANMLQKCQGHERQKN